jgi:membrane protease YdiL (CAAX protease family)
MSIAQGLPPIGPPAASASPTGRDVLLGLSVSTVLFLLLAVGIGIAHLFYPGDWLRGPWGLLLQLALANAVLAAAALAVAARRGWAMFLFKPLRAGMLAICAAGGAAGGITLALLLTLLSEAVGVRLHGVNDELMGVDELPPLGLALFALIAAGTTPLVEELIFRGLLFQWLRGRIGAVGGALASALLFGALHWPTGQAIWAGLVGFALALLFDRTGSLWASVAAHSGNNALAIVLVLTLVV